MAFRIAHNAPQAYGKDTAPVKSRTYLAWLHTLPCVVSGRSPVEAAHVNFANQAFGAHGRGKGQKASDRWALPLHPEIHREQHRSNEQEWWHSQGINPHLIATILWGLWKERGDDATAEAERIIRSQAHATPPPAIPGD
jgi:hypothetical protein